ncbi:hypothetical protein [Roseovarius spongiae]|nr:hypothetical protein [Roseovarius spongiae]
MTDAERNRSLAADMRIATNGFEALFQHQQTRTIRVELETG